MSTLSSLDDLFTSVDNLSSIIEAVSVKIEQGLKTPKGREFRSQILNQCSELRIEFDSIVDLVGDFAETTTTEEGKREIKKQVSFLRVVEKELERIEERSKGLRSFRVFSCFQHKGGVSKTSSNFVIGTMLGKHFNKKVLIIDLDIQGNMSNIIDYKFEFGRTGIKRLLEFGLELPEVIEKSRYTNVDIITNSIANDSAQSSLEQNKGSGASFMLRKIIKENLDFINENYDYIILDFAPSISSQFNRNGFFVIDTFIYMTKPELLGASFSVDGIVSFEMEYSKPLFQDNLDKEQKFCILRNMVMPNEIITKDFIKRLASHVEFEETEILNTMIHRTTVFEQLIGSGNVLEPSSDTTKQRLYDEYMTLILELMEKDYI